MAHITLIIINNLLMINMGLQYGLKITYLLKELEFAQVTSLVADLQVLATMQAEHLELLPLSPTAKIYSISLPIF